MLAIQTLLVTTGAVLVTAGSSRSGHGHRGTEGCAFLDPTSSQKHFKTLQNLRLDEADLTRREECEDVDIVVNLHAAVPAQASDDMVTGEQMYRQYEVLRDEYKPYGFNMILGDVTRTLNDDLVKMEIEFDEEDDLAGSTPEIEAFWKKHRTGDYKSLHIFIYQQMDNALGLCNFPDKDRKADTFYLDACHIVADSMPGSGSKGIWNNGGSAVHEVGHWFGLLHTWSESCDDEGDLIHDTPHQIEPSMRGCENVTDSCPDKPGMAKGNNFMDYSGDECQTEFTPGQKERMHHLWHAIRAKK